MMNAEELHEALSLMTDGLLTLEEGRRYYLMHGGKLDAFEAFVAEHRAKIFTDLEAFGIES
jgi:hypothetical protein